MPEIASLEWLYMAGVLAVAYRTLQATAPRHASRDQGAAYDVS